MDIDTDIYQEVSNTNGDGSEERSGNNLGTNTENITTEIKEGTECISDPNEVVCLPNEANSTESIVSMNDSTDQYLIAVSTSDDVVTSTAISVSLEYVEQDACSIEAIDENITVHTNEEVQTDMPEVIEDDRVISQETSEVPISSLSKYDDPTEEVNRTFEIDLTVDNEVKTDSAPSIEHTVATETVETIEETVETIVETVEKSIDGDSCLESQVDSVGETIAVDEVMSQSVVTGEELVVQQVEHVIAVADEELVVQQVEHVIADEVVTDEVHDSAAIVEGDIIEEECVVVDKDEVPVVESKVKNLEEYVTTDEAPAEKAPLVESPDVIEGTEISLGEAISLQPPEEGTAPPALSHQDSIEHQLSQIVDDHSPDNRPVAQQEEEEEEQTPAMSIAEAISRDFDESEEESLPHPEQPDQVVVCEQVVDIADRLDHGPVTVTDNSGQVYFVEAVEEVIVVENNVDIRDDADDVDGVDVGYREDGVEGEKTEKPSDHPLAQPDVPPIPSHMLGRNLDNPVEDTFRNGKIPPKPRLGVKIPYKNLTSQIVTKDEIAQEILERQRAKQGDHKTNPTNLLFTKKLTQRLAKKIAPPSTTSTKLDKPIQDNSDLIAILEGKDDQIAHSITSRRNVSTHVQEEQIVVIDKDLEREIALKQLSELPRRGRRRRNYGGYSAIENVTIPPRIKLKTEERKLVVVVNKKVDVNPTVKVGDGNVALTENVDGNIAEGVKVVGVAVQSAQKNEVESNKVEAGGTISYGNITVKKIDAEMLEPKKGEEKVVEVKVVGLKKKVEEKVVDVKKKVEEKVVDVKKKVDDKVIEVKNKTEEKVIEEKKKTDEKVVEVKKKPEEKAVEAKKKIEPKVVDVVKKTDDKKVGAKSSEEKNKIDVVKKIEIKSIEILKPNKVDTPTKTPVKAKIDLELKPVTDMPKSKSQPTAPIKTYERKRKSTEELLVPEKKIVRAIPPMAYITKSSRIIKKKVIWDPDEPSTAKYLAEKVTSPQKLVKVASMAVDTNKKAPQSRLSKEPQSKEDQQKKSESTEKMQKSKAPEKKPERIEKAPDTPTKGKKRLSEVDKLLMDEGAVNMLYQVKNEESRKSLDKVQKDLRNITDQIKKGLTEGTERTSPKLLRKKDSPPPPPPNLKKITRKKSKDSSRSSMHSPPPSPSAFPNIADASRIIRRHSSSSFSSIEGADDKNQEERSAGKRKANAAGVAGRKRTRRDAEMEKAEKAKRNDENFTKLALEEVVDADFEFNYEKFTAYKTVSVRQLDNLVQAVLKPADNDKAYLTLEVLVELTQLLDKLQKDSTCNVVVISSCAPSFCHGINYKLLCVEKEQARKATAKKLATAVTGYLRALANFPKILVAGVHGECIGLGVTMLPLFDMVITCDNALFSIPNAKLGCAAEGGSLLSLPHLMHNVLVSELLYASRKLAAPEALRLGMVTRVIWPNKFQQELINAVKITSSHSLQFMQATKKQLRTRMKAQIEESLSGEIDTLLESWMSAECQKNFASYD